MSQQPVIDALLTALAADPTDAAIRAHVANLLLDAGRADEAREQARTGLSHAPADVALLTVAAAAADAVGADAEATGYRTLLQALGGPGSHGGASPADSTPEPRPPRRPTAGNREPDHGDGTDADIDADEAEPTRLPLGLGDGANVPDTASDLMARWEQSDAPDEPEIGVMSRPSTRLTDVGGMQAVKERLELSFLGPLRNPEMQAAFGKSLRGGLMLWGPPGCGKTYIARAVAGELGASFYEVGLADVLDMWVGSSERNLRSIFDVARSNRPCVLFFDEIDALGMKRSQLRGGGSSMRGVVNQLLTELDGVTSDNEGIFVLAATNHPWDVDPALLRPGRLDRSLLVLPPDEPARAAIVRHHLKGKPVDAIDADRVAAATNGLTGADLALICEQATEDALAASMRSGSVRPITTKNLLGIARKAKPSIAAWLETARNHATYSNQDGTYDELLAYLQRRK